MGQLTSQLGGRVYLDTNIIIYAVEGHETHAELIKAVLQALTERQLVAVTSDLTLAEVLIKPKRHGNANIEEAYRRFLSPTEVWQNVSITREILEDAASLRATTSLKLPDAIHFASAIQYRCDSFLTNDHCFQKLSGLKVVMLSELPVR